MSQICDIYKGFLCKYIFLTCRKLATMLYIRCRKFATCQKYIYIYIYTKTLYIYRKFATFQIYIKIATGNYNHNFGKFSGNANEKNHRTLRTVPIYQTGSPLLTVDFVHGANKTKNIPTSSTLAVRIWDGRHFAATRNLRSRDRTRA